MGMSGVPVMLNPKRFCRTPKLASLVRTVGFHRTAGRPSIVGAIRKRIAKIGPDVRDALADCNLNEAAAVVERKVTNASNSFWYGQSGYASAPLEGPNPDARHAFSHRDVGKASAEQEGPGTTALVKRPVLNVGYAVGDSDAGQVREPLESVAPNAGNRQPINGAGDGH